MIPVEEALEKIIRGVSATSAETVSLTDALGRVLAEDLTARVSSPPADVSAMDGYAARADDVKETPVTLKRIGESAAGGGFSGRIGAGETVRIFTGAPVPDGADAIVIQENTDVDGDAITVRTSAPKDKFIRPKGLDFSEGDCLLKTGRIMSARDVGLAAAMNIPWVSVRRRPRIAILATGNEVVMPGEPLGPSQIISSNSLALGAYVKALGGDPVMLGIAGDDEKSLADAFAGGRGADLLVTIGGASVGDYDLVNKVMGDLGGKGALDLGFYKVAMRPGKPLIFGRLGDVPVLGLPGNPVSAGVCSAVFLKPAMETMLGIDSLKAPSPTARLGCDLGANDERQDYLRASLEINRDGHALATPFDAQDSAMMARLADAGCLVIRPPLAPPARAGDAVPIVTLDRGFFTL